MHATDDLREEVRERYARSARAVTDQTGGCGCGSGSCCADGASDAAFGEALYDAEQRGELPDAAVLASLGCGNPTAVADLHEGETVLDLGSGGGIDVMLSARRVGADGARVRPRHDGRDARARTQERRRGGQRRTRLPEGDHRGRPAAGGIGRRRDLELRDQPLDRQACGARRDRPRAEAGRACRRRRTSWPRIASRRPSAPSAGRYVGCIAGALSKREYEDGLAAAGFEDVEVTFTHEVADGMHGAIVKAMKSAAPVEKALPVLQNADCC